MEVENQGGCWIPRQVFGVRGEEEGSGQQAFNCRWGPFPDICSRLPGAVPKGGDSALSGSDSGPCHLS